VGLLGAINIPVLRRNGPENQLVALPELAPCSCTPPYAIIVGEFPDRDGTWVTLPDGTRAEKILALPLRRYYCRRCDLRRICDSLLAHQAGRRPFTSGHSPTEHFGRRARSYRRCRRTRAIRGSDPPPGKWASTLRLVRPRQHAGDGDPRNAPRPRTPQVMPLPALPGAHNDFRRG